MARKNFAATGSFIAEDRPRALDLLGFSSQLVFNTFHNGRLHDLEHGGDPDLAYAAARAHNRGMLEFCSVDPRLLPSLYVPLVDPEQAVAATRDALEQGAAALLVASGCPPRFSPSHNDLFGVWAQAAGGGDPGRLPRRRHRDPGRPQLLRQRQTGPARLPRRRGELPLGGLHGHPGPARPDARDPDLRRRPREVPRLAHRRHRAGRHLGAVLAAADGVRLRGLPPPRGAAAGALAATERLRAPSGPLHPLPDGGCGLDRGAGRARPRAVLVRLPARRGWPQALGALRVLARRCGRGRAPEVLLGQLPLPHGDRGTRLAA